MTHQIGQFCSDPCTVCNDRPTATYWASIGRNVATSTFDGDTFTTTCEPMTDDAWHAFRRTLSAIIEDSGATILATVNGEAGGQQWAPEATFLVLATDWPTGRHADALQRRLERLAYDYGQDAIGLVGGPGETLVYADGQGPATILPSA